MWATSEAAQPCLGASRSRPALAVRSLQLRRKPPPRRNRPEAGTEWSRARLGRATTAERMEPRIGDHPASFVEGTA